MNNRIRRSGRLAVQVSRSLKTGGLVLMAFLLFLPGPARAAGAAGAGPATVNPADLDRLLKEGGATVLNVIAGSSAWTAGFRVRSVRPPGIRRCCFPGLRRTGIARWFSTAGFGNAPRRIRISRPRGPLVTRRSGAQGRPGCLERGRVLRRVSRADSPDAPACSPARRAQGLAGAETAPDSPRHPDARRVQARPHRGGRQYSPRGASRALSGNPPRQTDSGCGRPRRAVVSRGVVSPEKGLDAVRLFGGMRQWQVFLEKESKSRGKPRKNP